MAGLEQIRKKLLPLLNTDNNNSSLNPDMSIDASASYKVRSSLPFLLDFSPNAPNSVLPCVCFPLSSFLLLEKF
jgi:hypothetical protein